MTLNEIAIKHGTDKSSAHHDFCRIYEPYFEKIKTQCIIENRPVNIIEIGIFNGASLKMLEEYFEGNCNIYGFDIEDKHQYASEHIHIFKCDQSDVSMMDELIISTGQSTFDIILEDGSHQWRHQIISLLTLSNYVTPETGIYICEDAHTSYASYNLSKQVYNPENDDISLSPVYFLTLYPVTDYSNTYINDYNKYLIFFKKYVKDVAIYNLGNITNESKLFANRSNVTAIINFRKS